MSDKRTPQRRCQSFELPHKRVVQCSLLAGHPGPHKNTSGDPVPTWKGSAMITPQEREPISERELQQIKSSLISWNNADRLVLSLEQAHAELRELRKENARLKHVAATYARVVQVIEAMKGEARD